MLTVTMDDGVIINYRIDDLTKPWDAEPDVMLMLHRHIEHMEFLNPLAYGLCGKFHVVRMDMRGRGKSTAPPKGKTLSGGPDESTLFERQAQDALALMDHLQIPKFHFCGAGGGGMTGIVIAVEHPERLKSLTIIAAPCRISENIRRDWRQGEKTLAEAVEKLGAKEWIRKAFWGKALDHTKAEPAFARWNLAQRDQIPEHVLISSMTGALPFDFCNRMKEIRVPTLMLHEEKNRAVDLDQQQFMQSQIPNSKLIVYEGMELGLHTITPERCTKDILEFIESLDKV